MSPPPNDAKKGPRKQEKANAPPPPTNLKNRLLRGPKLRFDSDRSYYVELTSDRFHGLLPMEGNRPQHPEGMEICRKLVLILFSLGFGIALVWIGVWRMNDCKAEPMIPKYLVGKRFLGLHFQST